MTAPGCGVLAAILEGSSAGLSATDIRQRGVLTVQAVWVCVCGGGGGECVRACVRIYVWVYTPCVLCVYVSGGCVRAGGCACVCMCVRACMYVYVRA